MDLASCAVVSLWSTIPNQCLAFLRTKDGWSSFGDTTRTNMIHLFPITIQTIAERKVSVDVHGCINPGQRNGIVQTTQAVVLLGLVLATSVTTDEICYLPLQPKAVNARKVTQNEMARKKTGKAACFTCLFHAFWKQKKSLNALMLSVTRDDSFNFSMH